MGKLVYEGLKVLDFTSNIAGPTTGALFANLGAEVIHIERPVYGDDCRTYLPQVDGVSMPHMYINNNKKSFEVDLKDPRAIDMILKLVKTTDVLIESNRPGVMKRLGLDYKTLKEINRGLVYCSISAFGQVGPYAKRPGYDVIGQAVSGIMHMTGEYDGPPTKIGIAVGDYVATLNAFGSIATALYSRALTGEGQHVDVSLARGLTWMSAKLDYEVTGKEEHRNGNFHLTLAPYGLFEGNNGQSIVIATLSQNLWEKLCVVMEKEEFIKDPRYIDNKRRCDNMKSLNSSIEEWIRSFDDISEVEKLLSAEGIPNSKVYTHKDVNEDPHFNECGWIVDIPVQKGVTTTKTKRAVGSPFSFSSCKPVFGRAPALGEHNQEIMMKLGYTKEEADALSAEWRKKYTR